MSTAIATTLALPTGTWSADPSHSAIEFRVKHMMIATVKGRFTGFDATIEAPEDGSPSIAGVIQAASIDTHEPQRDDHLRSPDFFDADAYPTITFASTGIEAVGDDRLRIVGDLTIKNVTRQVELEATLQGTGRDPWGNERVALEARGAISRSEFGLTWNQVLETGGVLVGDTIKVHLDISAVKAS